ncbi:predicted protein, partial [Aspergillus udagawae]
MKFLTLLSATLPLMAIASPIPDTEHPEWPANNAVRPGETPNSESENKEFTYWRRGMDHPEWPANNAVRPGETPNSESENKEFTY